MAEDKSMANGDNINHEPSKKVTPVDENNSSMDGIKKTVEQPPDDPGTSVTSSTLEDNTSSENSNPIIHKNQLTDDSDTSSDKSDTDSEDDKIKAPIELLGEFLLYIRKGNWLDAKKLCQMILLYEPENPEALQFRGVIDEKIQVEKELAEEERNDDDSGDSSSDGDEASTDDDNDNNDDDRASSSSESEDEDTSDDDDDKNHEHLKNKLIFPKKDDDDKTEPKT